MSNDIPGSHVHMSQVFHEDDDFLIVKIPKHDDIEITLGQAETEDQFLSLIFVRRGDDDPSTLETWIPWQKDDDDE